MALIDAGIKRLVVGTLDVNPLVAGRGLNACREAGIDVSSGVLEVEAQALNPGFAMRMQEGRPRLTCKLAMSVDGRTAMASGESQWITGPAARADVQKLRAQSCAIITGSGTVQADDPALTVRPAQWREELPYGVGERQPMRVVLDRKAHCSGDESVFTGEGKALLVCGKGVAPAFEVDSIDCATDPAALLQYLGQRECNEVLLEAGPKLAGTFLQAGLIDQLIVYVAPKLMGSLARPLFELPLELMADAVDLEIQDIRAVGDDWRLTLSVLSGE
jgi:diaminohydroxyphosphoribosylaminopyrimidine deaminase/5-amino-6-(5-phosphoribosylamino)uracil reductase